MNDVFQQQSYNGTNMKNDQWCATKLYVHSCVVDTKQIHSKKPEEMAKGLHIHITKTNTYDMREFQNNLMQIAVVVF